MTEPAHILPETARSGACGQLCIGEVALSQLVEQFGSLLTFYEVATRAPAVAANRHGLVSYPGETASVSTAKAFAAVGLLRLLASEGLGVDCVS
ncbi:MAG: diaminopimelate decarboxylase, partial [Thermomicrobium sp.]|nr:diaminopimelate decarboxylase [Thermomicrobium sp.]